MATELEELQQQYDQLVQDSREIEDTLQQELEVEQAKAAAVAAALEAKDAALREAGQAVDRAHARLAVLEEQATAWRAERAQLEERLDALETENRQVTAVAVEAQAKLEQAVEDHELLQTEFEEQRLTAQQHQARQRTELDEARNELYRLHAATPPMPPPDAEAHSPGPSSCMELPGGSGVSRSSRRRDSCSMQ